MQRSRLDNGGATCVCAVLSEARWRGGIHRAGRGERAAWTKRDRSRLNEGEGELEREREREGLDRVVGEKEWGGPSVGDRRERE